MASQKHERPAFLFNRGDPVKIPHYGVKIGRVVELRGPLGPGGAQVYRVLVRRKPKLVYIELTEDEIELAPAKS